MPRFSLHLSSRLLCCVALVALCNSCIGELHPGAEPSGGLGWVAVSVEANSLRNIESRPAVQSNTYDWLGSNHQELVLDTVMLSIDSLRGIRVGDSEEPSGLSVGYIAVPGIVTLRGVSLDSILVNNLDDRVTLDLTNWESPLELSREQGGWPFQLPPLEPPSLPASDVPTEVTIAFECPEAIEGVFLGWQRGFLSSGNSCIVL